MGEITFKFACTQINCNAEARSTTQGKKEIEFPLKNTRLESTVVSMNAIDQMSTTNQTDFFPKTERISNFVVGAPIAVENPRRAIPSGWCLLLSERRADDGDATLVEAVVLA